LCCWDAIKPKKGKDPMDLASLEIGDEVFYIIVKSIIGF
jgi:hypothetical protein